MASSDPWIKDREDLDRLANDLMSKVNIRNQQPKTGLQFSRLEGQISLMMKKFQERVQNLQDRLNVASTISEQERSRRQRLVDELNTRFLQIENSLKNSSSSNVRHELFGPTPVASVRPYTDSPEPQETVQDMKQFHEQLKREQDKGLDVLDEIITRQKTLVRGIGNQIDVQNEILDDIGDNMETTNVKLVRTTRNVQRVSRKADSCWYWIIIILLLIAIVVVASI